jgi:hypothetical protein
MKFLDRAYLWFANFMRYFGSIAFILGLFWVGYTSGSNKENKPLCHYICADKEHRIINGSCYCRDGGWKLYEGVAW